jgi:hypothetical protein
LGYCQYWTLATRLRPDFAEAQENRYLRADATFDMSPAQMNEAYREKIQKYAPIPLALQHYMMKSTSTQAGA